MATSHHESTSRQSGGLSRTFERGHLLSDKSDELPPPPHVYPTCDVCLTSRTLSGRHSGRDTQVELRDESNTTASARGDQESRSRRRHVEPRPKRGSLLSHSVGATRRLVANSSLRFYNLSRSVSHPNSQRRLLDLAHASSLSKMVRQFFLFGVLSETTNVKGLYVVGFALVARAFTY